MPAREQGTGAKGWLMGTYSLLAEDTVQEMENLQFGCIIIVSRPIPEYLVDSQC